MTLERVAALRSEQAVRVANASRDKRDKELERWERLDALWDELYWAEQMRQQVLPF